MDIISLDEKLTCSIQLHSVLDRLDVLMGLLRVKLKAVTVKSVLVSVCCE